MHLTSHGHRELHLRIRPSSIAAAVPANNLVIAGAYHGMALYGAQDSTIINNSVYGYFTASNGDVDETWIGVFDSGGTHPSNVIMRNNWL